MYRKNISFKESSAKKSRLGRIVRRTINFLTWFAHRSEGYLYDEDLGSAHDAFPKRRDGSRLPYAELTEEQRREAARGN